jgi:uncharacterized membrane protein YdcZ (DUF606 family)
MSIALLVPLLLGIMSVTQVGLNGRLATRSGLASAALLNMTVGWSLAVGFAVWCVVRGSGSGLYRFQFDANLFRWWSFFPGCIGFSLVVGMPWAVQKLGAQATFVALIGAQMLAGLLWDAWVEGTSLTVLRTLGAAFAVAGVVLTTWK